MTPDLTDEELAFLQGAFDLARAGDTARLVGYLDAGLPPARDFVRRIWGPELDAMAEPPTDPKTELQEWLMARGLPLPEYRVTSRSGPPHQPEFIMVVTGGSQEGVGTAGSKRLAERDAAADLLAKLQRT